VHKRGGARPEIDIVMANVHAKGAEASHGGGDVLVREHDTLKKRERERERREEKKKKRS
jgi:hypothetical protein